MSEFRRWSLPLCIRDRVTEAEGKRLGRVVLELRDRDMSYSAIASVLELYEGYTIGIDALRYWAYRLGVERSAAKAAATRARHAKAGVS